MSNSEWLLFDVCVANGGIETSRCASQAVVSRRVDAVAWVRQKRLPAQDGAKFVNIDDDDNLIQHLRVRGDVAEGVVAVKATFYKRGRRLTRSPLFSAVDV